MPVDCHCNTTCGCEQFERLPSPVRVSKTEANHRARSATHVAGTCLAMTSTCKSATRWSSPATTANTAKRRGWSWALRQGILVQCIPVHMPMHTLRTCDGDLRTAGTLACIRRASPQSRRQSHPHSLRRSRHMRCRGRACSVQPSTQTLAQLCGQWFLLFCTP